MKAPFSHLISPSYSICNLILLMIHNQKLNFYFLRSPKIEEPSPIVYSLPDPELPEAFVGTPISKASQKISR